jgi:hypothetical protein
MKTRSVIVIGRAFIPQLQRAATFPARVQQLDPVGIVDAQQARLRQKVVAPGPMGLEAKVPFNPANALITFKRSKHEYKISANLPVRSTAAIH